MAEAFVIPRGRLEVAICELQLVAGRQVPVVETVNLQADCPQRQGATGSTHGDRVGTAVVVAECVTQALGVGVPDRFFMLAAILGCDDHDVDAVVLADLAGIEATANSVASFEGIGGCLADGGLYCDCFNCGNCVHGCPLNEWVALL
ncbi:hypothetical protein D3C72_1710830 [compost metagenome]